MDELISRQAAIDALKNDMASLDHIIKGMSANDVRLDAYVSQRNQVNYDIYTINNLPAVQSEQLSMNLAEVGTDCISRQAEIDALRDYLVGKRCPDDGTLTCRLIENEVINKLPPIQPKRGKWLPDNNNYIYEQYVCSECKNSFKVDTCMGKPMWNFCPYCGAKMER